jgi:hypothetical protein
MTRGTFDECRAYTWQQINGIGERHASHNAQRHILISKCNNRLKWTEFAWLRNVTLRFANDICGRATVYGI